MDKPNKIKEYEQSEIYRCGRCNQDYCSECNEAREVDFEVKDEPETNNLPEFAKEKIEWKGEKVCPWCYNQLIDIAFPEEKKE